MKKIYIKPLEFIWNSFKGHKKMLYFFIFGKIIEGIFYVVLPILAKLEMDQLVEKNTELFGLIKLDSFSIFFMILALIFFIKLLENFLKSFIGIFEYDYLKQYENFYSKALYERLENVEPGIFLNSKNKRLVSEILSGASSIGSAIRGFIGDITSNFFVIIGISTVLILINFWIFIVLFIASFILFFLEKLERKLSEKQNFEDKYEYDEKIRILTNQMEKNLSYLISSGGFKLVLEYFDINNKHIRERIKIFEKKNMFLRIFSFGVDNLAEVLVKIIVAYSIFFSGVSIGTMTMTLLYVYRVNSIFEFIRHFRFSFDNFSDDLKKLNLFLDITKAPKNKKTNLKNFSKIEIKNMNFAYPNFIKYELKYFEIIENRIKSYSRDLDNQEKDQLHMIEEAKKEANIKNPIILKNINLVFETGKIYGIVGKNGAGKTTLISLLQNYFDSYSGNILIDSKELKEFSRNFFIENISIINQIPYIIDGFTIRENLMLGVTKKYSDEYIFSLLEKFNLKNKIQKNRLGLDTKIAYDNDFSGGERQLLALIRIILQDKKILIMDEGTNQLDAENELLVTKELLKNKSNKIIIFITHRMTSIKKTDIIYCLNNGTIEDFGNHKDLIKRRNIYSNFYKKQIGD